tara:strand:+ start:47 stop:463 length:417 start_codon:yes stop_codon:yes gene_type:complete
LSNENHIERKSKDRRIFGFAILLTLSFFMLQQMAGYFGFQTWLDVSWTTLWLVLAVLPASAAFILHRFSASYATLKSIGLILILSVLNTLAHFTADQFGLPIDLGGPAGTLLVLKINLFEYTIPVFIGAVLGSIARNW